MVVPSSDLTCFLASSFYINKNEKWTDGRNWKWVIPYRKETVGKVLGRFQQIWLFFYNFIQIQVS